MIKTRFYKQRRRSIVGFTLIELLVVLIIISVLFAIIAPGWVALMNRQRVNAVREQATQIIRQAQAEARQSKVSTTVIFDFPAGKVPRAAVIPRALDPASGQTAALLDTATIATITAWKELGNGDIPANSLDFNVFPAGTKNQLVFNANGAIDDISVKQASPNDYMFAVSVKQKNTSAATSRCVVVTTLLGATRLAEGTDCPAS